MYTTASSSKNVESEHFQRQGSLRKVIPADPTKEILYQKQNEEIDKMYKSYRQEYIVLAEYEMVQCENIKGVYIIPSKENALLWFGAIFVRDGYYEHGVFRFNISLHENFPDGEHPKVVFQSEIFHPVINAESGELYLLKAFPKWSKTDQHLWQVVKFIQWVFYNVEISMEHAVNEDAVTMLRNDRESFRTKAEESVKLSLSNFYNEPLSEDPHYITFEPFDTEVHDKCKESMIMTPAESTPNRIGFSWVLPGSSKSLTCPPTPPSDKES